MNTQTLELDGKQFVVIDRQDFDRLVAAAGIRENQLPALPPADKNGNRPALEYARVSLARKIILGRRAIGWSQAELAKRSGLRTETINRIERGRNTPDMLTMRKIDKALTAGEMATKSKRSKSSGRL